MWPRQHARTLGIHVVESLAERWNLVRVPDFCEGHYRHLRMALAIKSLTDVDDDPVTLRSAIATGGFVSDRPSVSYDGRSWWWDIRLPETLGEFRKRVACDLRVSKPTDLPAKLSAQIDRLPETSAE